MLSSVGRMPELSSFRQLSPYDWGFYALRILSLHDLDLQTGAILSGNWLVPPEERCCFINESKVILSPRIWDGYGHRNHVYSIGWDRISLFPETTRVSDRARHIRRCLAPGVFHLHAAQWMI